MTQFTTKPDEHGCVAEVTTGDGLCTVAVGPEDDKIGEEWGNVEVGFADVRALAAAILGWPVDQVTRVDPATHVVVERTDARASAALADAVGLPLHPLRDRFRAALAANGTRASGGFVGEPYAVPDHHVHEHFPEGGAR